MKQSLLTESAGWYCLEQIWSLNRMKLSELTVPVGSCFSLFPLLPSVSVFCLAMRTVEHLIEQTGMMYREIAERAGLDVERVAAIAEGRWTPSPDERARMAQAF